MTNKNILFDPEELEILKLGCEQVIEGKGLFSRNPFVNIDVAGFSSLMRLFHFEAVSRSAWHFTSESLNRCDAADSNVL